MAMRKEAKRVKFGQSLTGFDTQAISIINQLRGVITNLANMKTAIHADADFITADEDEVDIVIAKVNASINDIKKA